MNTESLIKSTTSLKPHEQNIIKNPNKDWTVSSILRILCGPLISDTHQKVSDDSTWSTKFDNGGH